MKRKVGLVHTVASLVPVFNDLAREIMPDVEVIHLTDEELLKDVLAAGKLDQAMANRAGKLAALAEKYGAEIVMLTCSSYGPSVKMAKNLVKVPFLRVDEAMADEAVKFGKRIGVIATAGTTLKPTADLIEERAELKGRKVEVETVLCSEAFKALRNGDPETHDRIVLEHLKELMKRVDVIVLAQASIARAVAKIPEAERKIPILSSLRLGIQRLKETLERLPKK